MTAGRGPVDARMNNRCLTGWGRPGDIGAQTGRRGRQAAGRSADTAGRAAGRGPYHAGMSDVLQRYQRVADAFAARIDGVRPDQWTDPTPCTDWTVRQLVVHATATQWRVLATVAGSEATEVDGDADLAGQWREATAAIAAALADPHQAGRTVGGMFGEQTFESLVGRLLCSDALVHTWDLARATGQDERLDPTAVTAATTFLAPLDEAIRAPGGFAPKLDPAPGADAQTALLNFCGRAV